jgi:hypothetical protein
MQLLYFAFYCITVTTYVHLNLYTCTYIVCIVFFRLYKILGIV